MTTLLVTNTEKLNAARLLKDSIANTSYYFFGGKQVDFPLQIVPAVNEDVQDTLVTAYRDMIFGKKIANVSLMIPYIAYESGVVYTMYDHENSTMFSSNFYAVVYNGAISYVWKCLDNNNGTPSTEEPQFGDIDSNDEYYSTSDGYVWKYMYSFTAQERATYSTINFCPVKIDQTISAASIDGIIDVIKVRESGSGYNNHLNGVFIAGIGGSQIRIGGNTVIYQLGNNMASTVNNFYNGCMLYLTSSANTLVRGQYKNIRSSFSNAIGNYIILESPFQYTPENGTVYEISPAVVISGSGQKIAAQARALINSVSGNSVSSIQMVAKGAGYNYAIANIAADITVGVVTEANVSPIYAPFHGHGYDPEQELYSKYLCISVKLSDTESNTIPATINQTNATATAYRQIGIIKEPLFSNVYVEFSNSVSTFVSEETVFKIRPMRLMTDIVANSSNSTIKSALGDFVNQLSVGDYVYLSDNTSTTFQLATVNSITNSSTIEINANSTFSSNSTVTGALYLARETRVGVVASTIISNTVYIANVGPSSIVSGDLLIGMTTGATGLVNTVSRSDRVKGFDTFMETYQYEGVSFSGTFVDNEIVYQGASLVLSTANAVYYHSETPSARRIHVTNQLGEFIADGSHVITGATSGATLIPDTKYAPEVVFGSGEVLYIENMAPINRIPDQTETFKIILQF